MNRELRKSLRRSIRASRGRFLAILAIVALGVGFFAGLKSSQPAMLHTADTFFRDCRLYDFQLMSSLGLTEEDAEAFRALPGIAAAEGACSADAYASFGGKTEEVYHFMTLTEQVAVPALRAGRMPEAADECLGDDRVFSEQDLGTVLTLTASNSEETGEHFTGESFTLVGIARSPRYISVDRGGSELGSGTPAGFVLIPREAFTDEVWHELLLWCDLPGELYSDEYQDALRRRRPVVETLLNRRGVLRMKELLRDAEEELAQARKELDEGWSEYRLGKRKSERELDTALEQLTAGQEQLNNSRSTMAESEATLSQEEQSFRQKQADYAARSADLAVRQAELSAKKQEISAALNDITLQRIQIEIERDAALSMYSTRLITAYTQILILQTDPEANAALIAELDLERQQAQAELDAQTAAIDQANTEKIAELDRQQAEWEAKQAELSESEAALAAEEMALQAAEMELSVTEGVLATSRQQLSGSYGQLDAAQAELSAGWEQYRLGTEKAEEELEKGRKELEDAERKLAEGEAELEDALQLDLYTLDRSANPGYVTFENDTSIVDAIAVAFPVFFALIAALVCVTTMTRMVSEERTQIGTLKALGYSSGVIMGKYLLYAGLSSFFGCVTGFFLGTTALPWLVWYAYNIMYNYADLIFVYRLPMFLACLLVSVPGSLFVTWLACRRVLSEKPAELIRPKAPVQGRRVLLEYIRPLWTRLPFLSKVSIRSAFRYPARVGMMLLGIGGCTALMIAGFGARDSVARVAEYQYEEISLYDIAVNLDEETAAEAEELWSGWTEASALIRRQDVRLENGARQKDSELILGDTAKLRPLLDLHRGNGEAVPWPGEGELVVTRKIADELNVGVGDTLQLTPQDSEGTPSGPARAYRVCGVCEYYVGHAVFAALTGGEDFRPNAAFLRTAPGEDADRRAAQLRSEEGVRYVSLTHVERETIESSMASIDLLVVMLVVCSAALAFITLYNLTNINLMERIREVATVQVLGFTPRETAAYILNENLLLSVLGAAVGLPLGKLLHRFVIEMIVQANMTFDVRIAGLSYLVSFALTALFALLTNLFMRRRLSAVNMAESLKSVE